VEEMDALSQQAADAVATAGVNRFKEMLNKWKEETFSFKSMKSWSSFCDRSKFALPKVTEIFARMKSNLSHFRLNYLLVFFLIVIYCIITNPWFLFTVGLVSGLWLYAFHWRKEAIKVFNHEVTSNEKTIALASVSILLFWFGSVSSTIFWLVGCTITVVSLHALFYTPHEETDFDFNTSFGEAKV